MKNNFFATFLIAGLVVGLLATLQFKTKIPIAGGFPSDEVVAKQDLLKSFLDEQSYLQSRIVSLRKELVKTQDVIDAQTEVANFDRLEALKRDIGLTEVRGEGLQILLGDSPVAIRSGAEASDVHLIQASEIRDVVNILFASGADAVSVNNQRVIATSPISSVGTTILVNNSHIAPPFTIRAVGDTEIMLQRLLNRDSLPAIYEKMRKQGIKFEILKKNVVVIPMYNGDLRTKHINLIDQ